MTIQKLIRLRVETRWRTAVDVFAERGAVHIKQGKSEVELDRDEAIELVTALRRVMRQTPVATDEDVPF